MGANLQGCEERALGGLAAIAEEGVCHARRQPRDMP